MLVRACQIQGLELREYYAAACGHCQAAVGFVQPASISHSIAKIHIV